MRGGVLVLNNTNISFLNKKLSNTVYNQRQIPDQIVYDGVVLRQDFDLKDRYVMDGQILWTNSVNGVFPDKNNMICMISHKDNPTVPRSDQIYWDGAYTGGGLIELGNDNPLRIQLNRVQKGEPISASLYPNNWLLAEFRLNWKDDELKPPPPAPSPTTLSKVSITSEPFANEGQNITLNTSIKMSDNSNPPQSGIIYQWYTSDYNGSNKTKIVNGNSSSITFKATKALKDKKIFVVATYKGKDITSESKTINVVLQRMIDLKIKGNVVLTEGQNISLTSEFVLNFGNPKDISSNQIKYEWYFVSNNVEQKINNQNSSTLNIKSELSMNTKMIILKAHYNDFEITSNAMSLVVEPKPAPPPVNPTPPTKEQSIESVSITGNHNFTIGDSLNLPCKITMNEGQPPSSGITYKWYKKDNNSETIISGQTSKVLSITIDASYKNKSIVVEATYKNKLVKSQPFVLNIKDKPVILDQTPSTPSSPSKPNGTESNSNNPSKPSNTVNGIDGNSGLVEDSGLDWWIYATTGGGVLLLIIIIVAIVSFKKKKKQKKQVKQNMKTQQVVRANGSNVKTITTSRTIPTRTISGAMPTFRNPPPTSKKR